MASASMVIGSLPGTTRPAKTTSPKIEYRRHFASLALDTMPI